LKKKGGGLLAKGKCGKEKGGPPGKKTSSDLKKGPQRGTEGP